ncbi:MAG: nucleotidyltransferase domain-containing protein [Chloroflexi bacterium]|nr:nucleotidyltransferase domain-containing protein [Chloroflexota bacterium]
MANPPAHDRAVRLLKEKLPTDEVHSIVLFGSVARGDAGPESDIDLLVIYDGSFETKRRFQDITYDIGLENSLLAQSVFFKPEGFEREVRWRSYFAQDVISQGIVLHDDGTYRGICRESLKAGSGVPER